MTDPVNIYEQTPPDWNAFGYFMRQAYDEYPSAQEQIFQIGLDVSWKITVRGKSYEDVIVAEAWHEIVKAITEARP